jgi:uncharacterized protein YdbL (DUF1318 family)
MKKLLLVSFLIMALVPAMCLAADTSHAAATGGKIDTIVAIGDASSGYLAEVSSNSGALNVAKGSQGINSTRTDGQLYTGVCKLQVVAITGVTAGDSVAIYDGTSTAGTFLFDPQIGTALSSTFIDCGGVSVATGIYADVYDY